MRAAVTTIGTCRGSRSHAPHEVRERGRPAPTAIWMLAGQTPTIVAVASIPPPRRDARHRYDRWRLPGQHPDGGGRRTPPLPHLVGTVATTPSAGADGGDRGPHRPPLTTAQAWLPV